MQNARLRSMPIANRNRLIVSPQSSEWRNSSLLRTPDVNILDTVNLRETLARTHTHTNTYSHSTRTAQLHRAIFGLMTKQVKQHL